MSKLLPVDVKLVDKRILSPLIRRLEIEKGSKYRSIEFLMRHLEDLFVRLISLFL